MRPVVATLATAAVLLVAVMFGVAGVVRGQVPSVSPSPSGSPPVTTVVGADNAWHGRAVRLVFVVEDRSGTGIAATEYQVDGGPWQTGTSLIIAAPRDHSNDGIHKIRYRSRDNAGGVEEPGECVVKIDTVAPRATWVSCRPAVRTRPGPQTIRVKIKEVTGASTITLLVVDASGSRIASVGLRQAGNGVRSLRWNGRGAGNKPVPPGTYGVKLLLRDGVGNSRVTGTRWFRDHRSVSSRVVRAGPRSRGMVALTFDDGASASAWAGILNVLRRYQVKASFFPVGPEVLAKASLARQTVREGHTIGNHSWSHPTMSRLGHYDALSQLRRTEAAWWRVARVTPAPFFRPPYGDMSAGTVVAAGAAGYLYTVLWDVDPYDWRNPGVSVITSRVLSAVRPGSIVVMHTCGQTAQALPAIIRGLRARGLRPVSLTEMFAAGLR